MTTPNITEAELKAGRWFVVEVMKTGARAFDWTALLIDIDPGLYRAGLGGPRRTKSRWLPLGRVRSREAAYDRAREMLATKH